MKEIMLKLKGIKKSFEGKTVLDGIDLEVKRGEVVAIIGPSGTGKSTLLRCINLLEMPDEGTVTIGELEVTAPKIKRKEQYDLRGQTSMVFQQYNLFANKTALENITEPLTRVKHLKKEEARRQAELAAAEEAARQEAESQEETTVYDEEGNEIDAEDAAANGDVVYDEEGNEIDPNEVVTEDSSDEVEYDEYGNVIDSDNTVDPSEYESSGSGSGSSVVDYATQFVGNPYVWGGTSLTNGADCSGFVQSVYSNFGVSLPRTSYEQQNAGTEVSYADAQPGDLICYGGHVAIYMGGGKIVHASNSRDGIKISNDATYRTILSVRRLV